MKAAAARDLLTAPAAVAVRAYARELVQRIDEAHAHWLFSPDAEALHDFRVALRRLRSWLEAYEPALPFPPKLHDRLKRLARTTNRARDAEVALDWLRTQRARLTAGERHGLRYLVERYEQERDGEYARLRNKLPKRWRRLEKPLTALLAGDGEAGDEGFAALCAGRLAAYHQNLTDAVSAVSGEQDEAIHRARIAAKRMRYLLEPLQPALPAARDLLGHLRRLQDQFGHIHDMNVLHNRLSRAVGKAAAAHARACLHAVLAPDGEAALVKLRRRDPVRGLIALARLARAEARAEYARFTAAARHAGGATAVLEKDMDPLRVELLGLGVRAEQPVVE